MSLFSSHQLAASAGKSLRTIRHHVKQGWLQPEPKHPGVRGWRFAERTARSWLQLYYPGRTLDPVLTQTPTPPVKLAPTLPHHQADPSYRTDQTAPGQPPAPVKPVGTWKQSLHHESAHYIVAGVAACGARVPEGTPWHDHTTGLRRCTRCMPKAL